MNAPPHLTARRLAGIPGVRHAFFTRRGGVSRGLYASLNVGQGSRDEPVAVSENRRRAAAIFGLPQSALATAYQIHSPTTLVVTKPWLGDRPQGDAVVTATPGLIGGVLSADCAPILIADPKARVVAAVHAGWRGALAGIVASAVAGMETLGARRAAMAAAVGPCIGPASYEVGPDFVAAFAAEGAWTERFFAPAKLPDKRLFDLAAFAAERLAQSGVANVEVLGRDTCAEADDFFSNRRATLRGEADYGRLLSAIVIC